MLTQRLPHSETCSYLQMLANLISKQALVHSIGPHAQCILQSQVHCKRSEPLPQSPDALFLDDSLSTMPDACKPGITGAGLEGTPVHRSYSAASTSNSTTPLYFPTWSSCSLVLITSIGCKQQASAAPPMEPACRI